jgi:hypothetical protein
MLKRLRGPEAKQSDSSSPMKKAKDITGQQQIKADARTPASPGGTGGHHSSRPVSSANSRPSPSPSKIVVPASSKLIPQSSTTGESNRPSSKSLSGGPTTTNGPASANQAVHSPPRVGGSERDLVESPPSKPADIVVKPAVHSGTKASTGSAIAGETSRGDLPSQKSSFSWLISFLVVPMLLLSNFLLFCVWYDTAWELEAAAHDRDQALRHIVLLKDTIDYLSKNEESHQELLDRNQDAFNDAMADLQAKMIEQEDLMEEVQATCYEALEDAFGDYDDDRENDSRDYDDDSRDDDNYEREAL